MVTEHESTRRRDDEAACPVSGLPVMQKPEWVGVQLDDNYYLFCVAPPGQSGCSTKTGYQFCLPTAQDTTCQPSRSDPKRGYKHQPLPQGASIVWQEPSPYADKRYESRISGNDVDRTWAGFQLFYQPDVCNSLASQ